mgnify:CR=1 FL=1
MGIFFCPDCESYPPHITSQVIVVNGIEGVGYECRDCGEYWEELETTENFFENTSDLGDLSDES